MSSYKVRFELDINGLNTLMKSEGMQKYLQEAAGQVSNKAGAGYGSAVDIASYEAIAKVYPYSQKAKTDNADNNTLLRSLQGAGLPLSKG